MKVLSYLEYSSKGGIVDVALQIEKLGWDGGVTDFFAQPFNPEFITELFEGWECVTDNHLFSEYANEEYSLNYNYTSNATMNFYIHDSRVSKFFFPRTLDDFINDCQRAGIELKWKEQNR